MKYNKRKAFTFAELMVMLSVFTVILAAVAPVFTVRYKNASTGVNVWSYVQSDDEYDAYAESFNKLLTNQFFIGITPASKKNVQEILKYNNDILYSKLIIRASDNLALKYIDTNQKQIRFLYGSSGHKGVDVGSLFAGGGSILLGGNYTGVSTTSLYNTAYGRNSLNSITSGGYNSALGAYSGQNLKTGTYNTFLGAYSGASFNGANGNTIIGYNNVNGESRSFNTVIGNHGSQLSIVAQNNTVIGDSAGGSKISGSNNTTIGHAAMGGKGSNSNLGGNTAIGNYALYNTDKGFGYGNTAVGMNACRNVTGSNKTCIGMNSGYGYNPVGGEDWLYSDSKERVYIGSQPNPEKSANYGGVSILEVHNLDDSKHSQPGNLGDSSVVINGNLIVRGQPFLTGNGRFYGGRALMGFKMQRPKSATKTHAFLGLDGKHPTSKVKGKKGVRHKKVGAARNCTCAHACDSATENGITSYDWSTMRNLDHKGGTASYYQAHEEDGVNYHWGKDFKDASTGAYCSTNTTSHDSMDIDLNMAHTGDKGSCCPDLRTSDIRLKNLIGSFTGGLEDLKRIKIYNYSFKSDKNKTPQTGVMAQDLKRVFPAAVTKDEDGYYQIRWDELFYSAINAIKEINSKVVSLAARIEKDSARVATLKNDNNELKKQVEILADELSTLENNKKLK